MTTTDTRFQRGKMKQVILSEEEQTDLTSALEQVRDLYELKADELQRNIQVAEKRIVDLKQSSKTIEELRTKVTLAENIRIEFEMAENEEREPYVDEVDTTHTICQCDICVSKRQSIISDGSIEQME